MTSKFKLTTWVHNRLKNSKSKSEKQSPDRPPHLPSPRSHPLTPKPSRESLAGQQIKAQPSSCLLFTKIPADIRHDIFMLAFGNRTLHMDLVFNHPLVPLPPEDQPGSATRKRRPNHAALNTHQLDYASADMPLQMDYDKSKVWRWGGTVCHRNVPGEPDSVLGWIHQWQAPWNDFCQLGNANCCTFHGGQWPDKCLIGIMGFLLSCKQAYAESIDILYGANCISIASEPLLLDLPQLILTQRLASITSLELSIRAHVDSPQPRHFNVDFGHLLPILAALTGHCTGLRRLYLSLQCAVYASPENFPVFSALEKTDAFFCLMNARGQLNLALELPKTVWSTCRDSAIRPSPEHELENNQPRLLWRCFGGAGEEDIPEMQMRSAGRYPKPPLQLSTSESEGKPVSSTGYWIVEGIDDQPWGVTQAFS